MRFSALLLSTVTFCHDWCSDQESTIVIVIFKELPVKFRLPYTSGLIVLAAVDVFADSAAKHIGSIRAIASVLVNPVMLLN